MLESVRAKIRGAGSTSAWDCLGSSAVAELPYDSYEDVVHYSLLPNRWR
jgi:hypothetical protein